MIQNIFKRMIDEIYIEYFNLTTGRSKVQIIDYLMIVDLGK